MGNGTGVMVFLLLIVIVDLLWKIRKNHIKYSKYKKMKLRKERQ